MWFPSVSFVSQLSDEHWRGGNLGCDRLHQAAGDNKFVSLVAPGGQEPLACGVNKRHAAQIKANGLLAIAALCASPALLQFPHPGPRQLPFELERQQFRAFVSGYPKHGPLSFF
jgi:hypothetical protein